MNPDTDYGRTSAGTGAGVRGSAGTAAGDGPGSAAVPAGQAPSPRDPLPHQLLTALAQHRIATTDQLRAMLRPHAARQTVWAPLNALREKGLVDQIVLPASHRARAWYLTPEGARHTRDLPALRGRPPYPVTAANAASLKTPHTLTTVRAHLAFATDAARRGDEHGYLDWTPETAHPIGDGQRLIADAVMRYTLHHPSQGPEQEQGRLKLRAFIEIDRATMSSERLATKLIDYARLHTYQSQPTGRHRNQQNANPGPGWLRYYPVYPRILFILTGATPHTLTSRIHDLQAMTREHPHVAALAREVPLGAAVLEDLEAHGPRADVWKPLAGGPACSWTEL
ncbi:replication-relaxation family protein [Streptomyces sp. NPDC005017]|uniref:replication-relaxation family protein n=1 Tax=Streptomyces sp. NPDC005017 TaxID=3364706 RepID=UPI0036975F3E